MAESYKKKVLISFTGSMELGGVERSLLGLLDALDYDKYEVDLFLYGHHGPLFSSINPKVNLMPEVKELAYLRESLKTKIKNKCFYSAFLRIVDEIRKKFCVVDNDKTWEKILDKSMNTLPKKYDIALGFFRPFDLIVKKVNADLKIGWVHTDYSVEGYNNEKLKSEYKQMDYIAAVSEECKNTFITLFPEFKKKTIVIENILSKNYIVEQSYESDVSHEMESTDEIKILSIGRFCTAKNFDNVPKICSLLVKKGIPVKWYLIGYGNDEKLILQKIEEYGMQEHVVILGKKSNPYPYIKACDLYVQPSRYEGKAVTVREAQILGKPVVITNYPTAKSQLEDGVDGLIVPMGNKECAEQIAELIKDEVRMREFASMCSNRDYSNATEVNKIEELLRKGNETAWEKKALL